MIEYIDVTGIDAAATLNVTADIIFVCVLVIEITATVTSSRGRFDV
jgi:hypothetical protein